MQIETEYPILFLSDASSNLTVPPYAGQAFATATSDCLCFSVLSYVVGASVVTVIDQECASGKVMFSGTIESSTGVLTVTDSASFRHLNIPVPPGRVTVDVWADHDSHPDWVSIKLGKIRNYWGVRLGSWPGSA